MLALAQEAGLRELAGEHLGLPTDKGANPGLKVSSLVAGMVAGADSIDDMALLRHGAMSKMFHRPYAPSTLGSFLPTFTFGHIRQLDAVACRFLAGLGQRTLVLAGVQERVLVDIDDTVIEVHGHAKQGSGYGYFGVRCLNALIATVTTDKAAPVTLAQRQRKGACGSPHQTSSVSTKPGTVQAKATTPHDPTHPDRRPRPGRVLRPTPEAAPAHSLALAGRLDHLVHPHLQTTPSHHAPTTQPATATPKEPVELTDSEVGRSVTPNRPKGPLDRKQMLRLRASVDRG